MITATKQQKQYIWKLCRFDIEMKKAVVFSITEGRTESTSELSHAEANTLIANLGGKPLTYNNWAFFDKENTKHKYILSLCMQYGWTVVGTGDSFVADLSRLSQWLKSDRSPVQKPLKKMNSIELSKVISALENMIKKRYK